jgi:hypothetical protein
MPRIKGIRDPEIAVHDLKTGFRAVENPARDGGLYAASIYP